MAKKNSKYTEKDIDILTDREHVRLRLPVYAGSTSSKNYNIPMFKNDTFAITQVTFVPAMYKCMGEILDNSIDEFAQIDTPNKLLQIQAQPSLSSYVISDNGRGVPIGKHSTGKHTPELVFSSLRTGRNFTEDKETGVIGQNGMGSSITNFCSSQFLIEIYRDNKRYRQTFNNGALDISKPIVRKCPNSKSGTKVTFQLDSKIFGENTLPNELIESRAIEIALTNPGITTEYNGSKYKFKKGFDDIIKKISTDFFKFAIGGIEFYILFDIHQGVDEKIFSWVNSSLLLDGGLCNVQFLNAFYDKVITSLTKDSSKAKCQVTKNDIRQNLLILGNLKLSDPEFDAQSKTRLTGPNLRKDIVELLEGSWDSFVKKNKEWLSQVLERSIVRHHVNANTKAINNHQKNNHKKIVGLVDATSKIRSKCQLLITEGDSAASMITDARDPEYTGSLPQRGKINNVYGTTAAQLLSMGKVTDLLTAIGLTPGKKAYRNELRYGKVVIATDADIDGSDIFVLLVNVFHQFWPELMDPDYTPFIYRLIAPNICLTKGKKRVHYTTAEEYEKEKTKYKSWDVLYYKGLGSMVREDWEMILTNENAMIPIIDDGKISEVLTLLFSKDREARKKWLQK